MKLRKMITVLSAITLMLTSCGVSALKGGNTEVGSKGNSTNSTREGRFFKTSDEEDVEYLKKKVDAGASHLLSQLFFDNEQFYRFLERCQMKGIKVPIEAGIMPATNKKSIERMVSMTRPARKNSRIRIFLSLAMKCNI